MNCFVFPLPNAVFFPNTTKPLNIFEPRYIQMVKDSLATQTPIALAFADSMIEDQIEPGQPLYFCKPVAGIGYPHVIEERPDGSMVILLDGQGKVVLEDVQASEKPYIVCKARPVDEKSDIAEASEPALKNLTKILFQWIEKNVGNKEQRSKFTESIKKPEEIVGFFGSFLVADSDIQQLLLEIDDINEKLKVMNTLIQSGQVIH